ncbi:MAG: hypothetical protein N4A35_16520 [Flavobacteriales bacterium]|jgi:hypothetical protein|nr:hypothetical protein [Flavobacteriales bacterium]
MLKTSLLASLLFLGNLCFGQDKITVNFNGKVYDKQVFLEKKYSNSAELLISAFELKIPQAELVSDGKQQKKGFRFIFSIDNHEAVTPLKKGDTLILDRTAWEREKQAYAQHEKAAKSDEYQTLKQQSDALNQKVEAKTERMQELALLIAQGDQNALKELEQLTNELANAVEQSSVTTVKVTPEDDHTPYFNLTFYIPYKNEKGENLEYELQVKTGKIEAYQIDPQTVELIFEGTAAMLYDDWDTNAYDKDRVNHSDSPNFGDLIKESGNIKGTVLLHF